MGIASDRVSRGKRVQEIQKLCGHEDDNLGFAKRLNQAAHELGLAENWHPTRLSKIRSGTQDLSGEDATVLAYLDPNGRGFTWVLFGIAAGIGEDPWAILAKNAKKERRAG